MNTYYPGGNIKIIPNLYLHIFNKVEYEIIVIFLVPVVNFDNNNNDYLFY